jgi:hypothetical protein
VFFWHILQLGLQAFCERLLNSLPFTPKDQ